MKTDKVTGTTKRQNEHLPLFRGYVNGDGIRPFTISFRAETPHLKQAHFQAIGATLTVFDYPALTPAILGPKKKDPGRGSLTTRIPLYCNENQKTYASLSDAARDLKTSPGNLSNYLKGTSKYRHVGGYTLQRATPEQVSSIEQPALTLPALG